MIFLRLLMYIIQNQELIEWSTLTILLNTGAPGDRYKVLLHVSWEGKNPHLNKLTLIQKWH